MGAKSEQEEQVVELYWEGPRRYSEVVSGKAGEWMNASGIYQVYGCHPAYGDDALLYIGRTIEQTFQERLKQEYWKWNRDPERVVVYGGRPVGDRMAKTAFKRLVESVEALLIYSMAPAGNSQNLNTLKETGLRVMNFGAYRALPPEISTRRWNRAADVEKLDYAERV